ncbi:MAG: hypothetical protein IPN79_04400 [Saprospiraceae bacterium]|nr:hypothetical protein [Saprospiraceae bacterium]
MYKIHLITIFMLFNTLCFGQFSFMQFYSDLDGFPAYFEDVINEFDSLPEVTSVKLIKVTNPFTVQDSGRVRFTTNGDLPTRILKPLAADYIDSVKYKWRGVSYDTLLDVTIIKNTSGICGTVIDRVNNDFYRIMPLDSVYSALLKVEHMDFECNHDPVEGIPDLTEENCEDFCPGHLDILFLIPPNVTITDPESLFGLMISDLEAAFKNSNIPHTVDFVYANTSWDDFTADECQIDAKAISANATINALKNSLGADVVVMIAPKQQYSMSLSALACVAEIGPLEEYSTAIVPLDLVLSNHIFVHEIGHLYGGLHFQGRYFVPVADCASSHTIFDLDVETLMGIHEPRILHFSDPEINYLGYATGSADENNAGRIRATGCRVADFTPSLNVNPIITSSVNSCLSGEIDLISQLDDENVNYVFEWYWNLSGIFSGSNPDYYLGSGANITITEPISDPCINYFIHLKIKLFGSEIARTTIVQRGGICSENVWCEESESSRSSGNVGFNSLDKMHVFEMEHNIQQISKGKKMYQIYNVYGQFIKEFIDPEEVKLMRYYLPAGMYVILVKENHNIVKTYKFTTINAY